MLRIKKKEKVKPFEKLPHDGNTVQGKASLALAPEEKACTALTGAKGLTTPINAVAPIMPDGESAPDIIKEKRMRLTGRHLPIVNCNTCHFTDTCPKYKAGYECAYMRDMLKRIQTMGDLKKAMRSLIEADLLRAQQAMIFEQLKGGGTDETTTLILDSAFNKLATLHDIVANSGDDDLLTAKGKGVVEALFGSLIRKAKPIEVEAKVIETQDSNEGSNNERKNGKDG